MREAYTGQSGNGAFQETASNGTGDADRLTNLRRAIDSIEQRLSAQGSAGNFNGARNDLGIMQQQLNRLSNEVGITAAPVVSPIANQPIPNAGVSGIPEFDAVTADILRRQQALNQTDGATAIAKAAQLQQAQAQAQAQTQALAAQRAQQEAQYQAQQKELQQIQQRAQKKTEELAQKQAKELAKQQKAAMDSIAKHFNELKGELAGLKHDVAKPITVQPKMETNDLQRIAERLSGMQKAPVLDEQAFSRLTEELGQLRSTMQDDLRREMSVTHDIQARLDNLAQGVDAMATQTGNAIVPRVDSLFTQLNSLRTTIDDLPQTLAITRIDDRLGEMAQKLEAIPVDVNHAAETDLSSVESRLDEVARALVAVSNMGQRAPELDLTAIDRLEARFNELSKTVNEMMNSDSKAVEVAEMQELAVRIEGLTERLGSFEQYADKGDIGAASALFAGPDTGLIEQQLQKLTTQLDEASNVNSTAAQISNLEAQLGQILRTMSKPNQAVSIDLAPVEERLGQIEDALVSTQQYSIEAAQQAAQQAVAMLGAQSDPGQIISALSEDLKALQDVAENGAAQNDQSIAELAVMLSNVVSRLGSIENTITDSGPRITTAVHQDELVVPAPAMPDVPQMEVGQPTIATRAANIMVNATTGETTFEHTEDPAVYNQSAHDAIEQVINDTQSFEAPPIDPIDVLTHPQDVNVANVVAENHQPLEPGQAPDVPNIAGEMPADTIPTGPVESLGNNPENLDAVQASLASIGDNIGAASDSAKPDPVGAARRALQATTAEINAVRDNVQTEVKEEGKDAKSALLAKLGGFNVRKPLVVAAAATLLMVLASFGYKKFIVGGEVGVAGMDAPGIEQTTPPVEGGTGFEVPTPASGEAALAVEGGDAKTPTPRIVGSEPTKQPLDNLTVTPSPDGDDGIAISIEPSPETTASLEKPAEMIETPAVVAPEIQVAPEAANETVIESPPAAPVAAAPKPMTASTSYDVPSSIGPAALVAAASSGDAKALFELGMRYSDGKAVKRDMVASAQWFEKAAETGFAPAQYSIGSLYEKGIGVTKDVKIASGWYEKAAAQGNARAMHNLAVINAMGAGGEPNMDTAVRWFKDAANFGIKDSQFNLGILYGQGMGVPQNLSESYKWFALAAKTGDTDAATKKDEVGKAMDPASLEAARAEVANWKPAQLNAAVNRVVVPDAWRTDVSTKVGGLDSVKKAQALLNERGFNVGTPDGLMGPKTKKAIMEFQRSAGLPITGAVDKKLLRSLGVSG